MRFTAIIAAIAAFSTVALGAAIDERDACGSEYPPYQCQRGTQACCDLCCKWVKNGVPSYEGYGPICGC
ncbi:unnamed protein product [Rhizoctonia solani]|uniref:Uncharacterized protein n=1 Tax=Rhizoctonia solani TaxID=456999 RepID=A0A8H3GG25_9AGAM|nr:unnamed protein product [Rhizoctonia solani]